MNYIVLKIDYFYPFVKKCYNCDKLGHTRKGCKAKSKCFNCGKEGICEQPCGSSKCILCDAADYKSNDRKKFPKWKKEEQTKLLR